MPKAGSKIPKFIIDTNGKILEFVAPKVKAIPAEKPVSKPKSSKRDREDESEPIEEVKRTKGKRILNTPKEDIERLWASIPSLPEKEGQKLQRDLIRECNQKKAWIRAFENLPRPNVDDADKKYTSAAALVARLRGLQMTQSESTPMMEGMKKRAEASFNAARALIVQFSSKEREEFEKRQSRNINAKTIYDLKTIKDAKASKAEVSPDVSTHDDGTEHLDVTSIVNPHVEETSDFVTTKNEPTTNASVTSPLETQIVEENME